MKTTNKKDFWDVCITCGLMYQNLVGMSPCCGSHTSRTYIKSVESPELINFETIINNIRSKLIDEIRK